MGSRPKLLFLSQTLPFPPDGGVKIRTYHTLRNVARAFDVTALCFYRWKAGKHEPDLGDARSELGRFGKIETFPIPQEHSRIRFLLDHVRSVVFNRVYTTSAYRSRSFDRALRQHLADVSYDLVHLDSLDLSAYLPLLGGLPTACVHHDAQSVLLLRRAEYQSAPLAWYFRHQAHLMQQEERRVCPKVDLNVTVSETDRQTLGAIAPSARFEVVPNGVDLDYFEPRSNQTESGIVFVGGTSWYPNRDALSYYRSVILPLIRERLPDASTTWVGRASADEIAAVSRVSDGLRLTGYVDDIRPHVASAACYVVPIRIGGGTRIKILDAWAMGKAVVSTTVGCEGLDARDGENILIADSPEKFAASVQRVLDDAELRRLLGTEARRTVEERYSWDAIGAEMNQTYLDLIGRSGSADQQTDSVSRTGVTGSA